MIGTSVLNQSHFLPPVEEFAQVQDLHSNPKELECLSFLKKCKNLEEFKQAQGRILKLGFFSKAFCTSNLIATCALSEWGSMRYACSIFEQVDDPGCFEFNTMIRGHVKEMNVEDALWLYTGMLDMGVEPDKFTYPALLKACSLLKALKVGMQIHGHIFKLGLEDDLYVQNSLINVYGKCEEVELSWAVFDQMEERSIASWSAIIAAYSRKEMWSECLRIFGEMMRENRWRAEESTLVSLLSACTHLDVLDLGRSIHGFLLRNLNRLNVTVETSLIDMYVKCGSLDKALSLFSKMQKKNRLSYTVMISGLGIHGKGREALRVFSEMEEQGFEPDDAVFVCVLSACGQAGLVDEGLECFRKIRLEYGIVPTIQHYGCMIDLLGRAGMLVEALQFIRSMPMEPNSVCWSSLLNACKIHQCLEIGEVAAENLFKLSSCKPGDYLTLSNMYGQAQRWEDVSKTKTEMNSKCSIQQPGFCSVEVKKRLYRFVSQDMSYPQYYGVDDMIYQMEWQLKFEGYSPDTSQVLLDVDEEEKKKRLSRHSQKLAIAFALIHTSHDSTIRIVRNLRMCSDCHKYTKLISVIYKREIVVRDRNRFHHFKDGTCSCNDYW